MLGEKVTMKQNKKSWSLYIDIEGFSQIYLEDSVRAYNIIRILAEDIFNIGVRVFPFDENRIFASQIVDGFIINSFVLNNLVRPLAIASALMRSVLFADGCLKIGVSYGDDMADIREMFHDELRDALQETTIVKLGTGTMTILPVMGEGLINSYNLLKNAPKGPLVILDKPIMDDLLKSELVIHDIDGYNVFDWVNSSISFCDDILNKIGIKPPYKKYEIKNRLNKYLKENKLSESWIKNTRIMIEQ